MTMAAIEGGAARGGTRSKARQRRPTDAEMGRGGTPRGGQARTQGRGERGATGAQGPRGPAREPKEPPEKPEKRSRSRRREVARRVTGAATKPGAAVHNYQAIVAAEFVGAALLAALSPFSAKTPHATQQSSTSMSPYGPGDLVKIFAIGITYMILEFLAAGPRGLARFAAWFGALIFLVVGLSELSNIAQIFKTISGGNVNPVKLTAAQAPVTKGNVTIPPLGQGAPSSAAPPPAPGTAPAPDIGNLFPKIGPAAAEGGGGSLGGTGG